MRDLDVSSLVDAMPTYTAAGREALTQRLSEPLTDLVDLQKRQDQVKAIKAECKKHTTKITELRKQLQATEDDVHSVADASSDKRHAEYYTQILWSPTSHFAALNRLGWLNEAIVFFRTLFLPGLSVLLPLFILLAPLIMYSVVLNQPLTVQGYFTLLNTSLKKAMPSVLGKPRFAGSGGVLELGEQFLHIGVSIAMFVASIWNQISAASTMRAVVDDMRKRADSVKAFAQATTELGGILGVSVEAMEWPVGQLGLFGDAWNTPSRIQTLLKKAGELDMLAAIATAKRTCFPTLGSGQLSVIDLFHPGLQPKARIYNSLTLDPDASGNQAHVLLTGPNRGGKSTLLKALGCAVLMAHTTGVVFARSASIPVFTSIIAALTPQDSIGKLSLFEAEIEFAKSVKARLAEPDAGNTFLMMDEIFHGTNAHDGVEASQVFLDDLYKTKKGLFSIVSTHYMDLPARYGPTPAGNGLTQNLCMDASVDPADPDRLVYTYQLKAGVNQYSSVREILRERGLLTRGSLDKKTTRSASKV